MTFIFCLHYFLWYGAHTTIYGYESVYSRYYTHASTIQFGTLKMILPFVAVMITPFICSLADRRRKHRLYFTQALLVATLAMVAFCVLPLLITEEQVMTTVDPITVNTEIIMTKKVHDGNNNNDSSSSSSRDYYAPKTDQQLLLGPFIFFALASLLYELAFAVNTCLSDSFAVLQAEEQGTNFGRIIVWGTFGWALSALVLSLVNQINVLPRLLPGILMGTMMLGADLIVCAFWPNENDFKLDTIPPSAAMTLTGSSPSNRRDPNDYQPANEINRINLGSASSNVILNGATTAEETNRIAKKVSVIIVSSPSSVGQQNKRLGLVCSTTNVGGRKTISPVDLLAASREKIQRLAKEPFGQQLTDNLIGTTATTTKTTTTTTISDQSSPPTPASEIKTINSDLEPTPKATSDIRASTSPAAKAANDPCLEEHRQPQDNVLEPLPTKLIIKVDDNWSKAKRNNHIDKQPVEQHQQQEDYQTSIWLQLKLIGLILSRRSSFIRYLILFVLSGFFMSMHWNYFFLYLEQIHPEKFELISALSMFYQGLLGELPFFILSRKVIDILGRSHTISLSLITIGLRFLLYHFVLGAQGASGFLTIVADCFQGPNYGLFYVVMTEVGLEYSYCDDELIEYLAVRNLIDRQNVRQVDSVRMALRSTVQSVAFACYEGLGVGLGGLVGGWILSQYDFETLWLVMAFLCLSLGLLNVPIELWLGEDGLDRAIDYAEHYYCIPNKHEEDNSSKKQKRRKQQQQEQEICIKTEKFDATKRRKQRDSELLAQLAAAELNEGEETSIKKWPSDWRDFHLAQQSGRLERISSVTLKSYSLENGRGSGGGGRGEASGQQKNLQQ